MRRIYPTVTWTPGESIFDGPPPLETPDKGCLVDAFFSRPLCNGLGFPVKSDKRTASTVVVLNFTNSPSTVIGTVVSSGVDAVKRVFRTGFTSHICKEVLEIVLPSLANNNAPLSVVRVAAIRLCIATRLHGRPRSVFGRSEFTVRGYSVNLQAPTASRTSRHKIGRGSEPGFSALAFAKPLNVATHIRRALNNRPPSENLSGQIKNSHFIHPLLTQYYKGLYHKKEGYTSAI